MAFFFDIWMWIGLGSGITILIILLCTNLARRDLAISRWKDPMWIAWLGAILYMFHNVEEYGIDLTGTHNHFVGLMRMIFGDVISDWAFLGCNIPLVWIAGPVIAWICWKKDMKGMATGMALFELVNGVSHLVQGVRLGYNSGLATGVVLFIPFAIWVIYVVYGKKHLSWGHFGLMFLVAFLYHALLITGCQLAVHGILLGFGQFIYMTLDAALMIWLFYVINKSPKFGNWKETE